MTLDAHSNLVEGAIQLLNDISNLSSSCHQFSDPSQSELQADLQQHIDRVNSHKQRLSMLLESSESTSRIVRKNKASRPAEHQTLTFCPSSLSYSTTAMTKWSTKTSSP